LLFLKLLSLDSTNQEGRCDTDRAYRGLQGKVHYNLETFDRGLRTPVVVYFSDDERECRGTEKAEMHTNAGKPHIARSSQDRKAGCTAWNFLSS
jgi:hypothetical protein